MTQSSDEQSAGAIGPLADPALDAYIDGRLTPAERAAFEARLLRDPALRGEVDAHRRIEAALRSHFAEPQTDRREQVGTARAPAAPTWRLWGIGIAAAVVLLVAAWQWLAPGFSRPRSVGERLLAEYASQVSAGFVPKEVCTTSEAFAAWTSNAYGVAISPAALPASVHLLGWSRRDTLSSYTGVLLADADGRQVAVFMDPVGNAMKDETPKGRGDLHIFTQRMGGLMLYEVTPSDRPAVLPGLSLVNANR